MSAEQPDFVGADREPSVVDNGLFNALSILARNMVQRGGDERRMFRGRPGVDFVTIVNTSSLDEPTREVQIDLYSSGYFGLYTQGVPIPVGRMESRSVVDDVLHLYAMLTDKELADKLEKEGLVKGFNDGTLHTGGDEVVEELMPSVDRFVEANRERLSIAFTQHVVSALRGIISDPQRSSFS